MSDFTNIEEKVVEKIDEGFGSEGIFSDSTSEEFLKQFERTKNIKRKLIDLSGVIQNLVFQKNREDTAEDIKAITDYITGPEAEWCCRSPEVVEFRYALSSSFTYEWKEFEKVNPCLTMAQAMRSLPPRFCLPQLQKAQREMLTRLSPSKVSNFFGLILLRIWYIDLSGCTCSSLREFSFDTVASEAIKVTMERLFSVTNFDTTKGRGLVYLFRVHGRNEYVYGNEKLIDFRYIRDSITQQREVNLVVEPYDEALLTDPVFVPSYRPHAMSQVNCADLSLGGTNYFNPVHETSLWNIHGNLEVTIEEGLKNYIFPSERAKEENIREGDTLYVAVLVEVYFGAKLLSPPKMTNWVLFRPMPDTKENESTGVVWDHGGNLVFDISLSDMPREIKLCVTLVATCGDRLGRVTDMNMEEMIRTTEDLSSEKKSEGQLSPVFFLGCASVQLFDYQARMRMGKVDVSLWNTTQKSNPMGTTCMNPDRSAIVLSLVFPVFPKPVVIPMLCPPKKKEKELECQIAEDDLHMSASLRENKIEQLRQLKRILSSDPLTRLTLSDDILLWKYRKDLIKRPKALAKFLLAVNWIRPYAVYEAHSLLEQWSLLLPIDALELLNAQYADTVVRQHAVNSLEKMNDYELRGYLLQLVQALKHEPYHYSALARFLLRRSLQSPLIIGHYVFWYLVSEMGNKAICERHGLLIEELIRRTPERKNYLRQLYVSDQLLECAMRVKEAPKKNRVDCLREILTTLRLPSHFTLALDPTMECNGIDIGKCKVMDSKKCPLWLVFRNSREGCDPFCVIFKAGDDLRQDLFTLQLLELMDIFWKASGLLLHVIPYGCVATGEGVGMIEVVLNSDTVANITRRDGGAHAAFTDEPLMNWLRQYNRGRHDVERCLWNFLYSVAGYTVATYVLGIGDRHNDNIMLRQDGTLFHIDYGHFLGNFKTKFGIKRETAPFIFTPMYVYMLGGQNNPIYRYFVDVACQAFNVIRRFSSTLITLFVLMLSTGIPELQRVEDIEWLRTVLLIDRSDEEAKYHYKMQVAHALSNMRTRLNEYIHIMAH